MCIAATKNDVALNPTPQKRDMSQSSDVAFDCHHWLSHGLQLQQWRQTALVTHGLLSMHGELLGICKGNNLDSHLVCGHLHGDVAHVIDAVAKSTPCLLNIAWLIVNSKRGNNIV